MEYHKPTIRVLQILELIDQNSKEGIGLSEISERLGLPKGTISPILRTLNDTGYIRLNMKNKRYYIGSKSFELGLSFGSDHDILSMIQKTMRQIVKNIGEICQFGVLSDRDVLYLLKESPDNVISIISNVGDKIPAYVSGLGKALLSGKTNEQLQKLYTDYEFKKYTPNSITDLHTLLTQIQETRETGIAHDNEESKEEICCVAVPLVINDEVKAALSVTIPKYRYTAAKKEEVVKELHEKKKMIEDICRIQQYRFTY